MGVVLTLVTYLPVGVVLTFLPVEVVLACLPVAVVLMVLTYLPVAVVLLAALPVLQVEAGDVLHQAFHVHQLLVAAQPPAHTEQRSFTNPSAVELSDEKNTGCTSSVFLGGYSGAGQFVVF